MKRRFLAICIWFMMIFGIGVVFDMKAQAQDSESIVITNVEMKASLTEDDGLVAGSNYSLNVTVQNTGSEEFSFTDYQYRLEAGDGSIDLTGTLSPNEIKNYEISGCKVANAWGEEVEEAVCLSRNWETIVIKEFTYNVSIKGMPAELVLEPSVPGEMYANVLYPFSLKITNNSSSIAAKDIYVEMSGHVDDSAEQEEIKSIKTIKPVNGVETSGNGWMIRELKPGASVTIAGDIKFLGAGDGRYGAAIIKCRAKDSDSEGDYTDDDPHSWSEYLFVTIKKCSHVYEETITKATISKDGSIIKKCKNCGNVEKSVPIYFPKTITLSKTDYTYNGKTQTPSVSITGSDGKVISESNYVVSYAAGRKNVGHYAVKINFKGNYEGSITKTFNINPKGTKMSGVKAAKKKIIVKWKKQDKKIKGYQIQYSTDKKFIAKVKTKTVSKKKTSITLKKLKSKKTYYVRVRTYQNASGGKCYSAWSAKKKVKVK